MGYKDHLPTTFSSLKRQNKELKSVVSNIFVSNPPAVTQTISDTGINLKPPSATQDLLNPLLDDIQDLSANIATTVEINLGKIVGRFHRLQLPDVAAITVNLVGLVKNKAEEFFLDLTKENTLNTPTVTFNPPIIGLTQSIIDNTTRLLAHVLARDTEDETRFELLTGVSGGGTGTFISADLSVDQTANLAVGNHIEFDRNTPPTGIGGGIVLQTGVGQADGIFELKAGITYFLSAAINPNFTGAGSAHFVWYDITNATEIGRRIFTDDTAPLVDQSKAEIIFTPSADVNVEVRIVVVTGTLTSILSDFTFAHIFEFLGGGATGSGITFPIKYPQDRKTGQIGTLAIDLNATDTHIKRYEISGNIVINFTNPPTTSEAVLGEFIIINPDATARTMTFVQTTTTPSINIPANSRTKIAFQAIEGSNNYDIDVVGSKLVGGGTAMLTDMSNMASPTLPSQNLAMNLKDINNLKNLVFASGSTGVITDVKLINFFGSPLADDGVIRFPNDVIFAAARNAANDGNIELKFSNSDRLDIVSSKTGSSSGLQIRALDAIAPENTLGLTMSPGASGEGLLDVNTTKLKFGTGGATRLTIDSSTITNLILESPSGVTSNSVINIISRHATLPDNTVSLTVGSGTGATALLDTTVSKLEFGAGGVSRLKLDVSTNTNLNLESPAGVTASTAFALVSRHTSDPDNTFSISQGSGTSGEALIETTRPILKIGSGANPRLILDTTTNTDLNLENVTGVTSNVSFDIVAHHATQADNVLAMIVTSGTAGSISIESTLAKLIFGAGGANRLTLDTVTNTALRLQNPSGTTANVILELKAEHATQPDNFLTITAGSGTSAFHIIDIENTQGLKIQTSGADKLRIDSLEFNIEVATKLNNNNLTETANIEPFTNETKNIGSLTGPRRYNNVFALNFRRSNDEFLAFGTFGAILAVTGTNEDITIDAERNLFLQINSVNVMQLQSSSIGMFQNLLLDTRHMRFAEITAPAAPIANQVVIFARVVGGKTELSARFNTGAIQKIAIEP